MSNPTNVLDHLAAIAAEAGLEVMDQILGIVSDREEVPDEVLLRLTADDMTALYEGFVGPAVDRVEKSLLGDYDA